MIWKAIYKRDIFKLISHSWKLIRRTQLNPISLKWKPPMRIKLELGLGLTSKPTNMPMPKLEILGSLWVLRDQIKTITTFETLESYRENRQLSCHYKICQKGRKRSRSRKACNWTWQWSWDSCYCHHPSRNLRTRTWPGLAVSPLPGLSLAGWLAPLQPQTRSIACNPYSSSSSSSPTTNHFVSSPEISFKIYSTCNVKLWNLYITCGWWRLSICNGQVCKPHSTRYCFSVSLPCFWTLFSHSPLYPFSLMHEPAWDPEQDSNHPLAKDRIWWWSFVL